MAVSKEIKLDSPEVRLAKHFRAGAFGSGARVHPSAAMRGNILYTHSYNGEKELGGIGPVRSYIPDYNVLRYRSWQAYLESEIAQIAIQRLATWMIGAGLKLQSEPVKIILESAGIRADFASFSKQIEARYHIFANSRHSDFSGMNPKTEISKTAFINSVVGGDVLVVLRYNDETKSTTIELIDGAHVQYQWGGTEISPYHLANGNRIIHGVELNKRDEHIAYWVQNKDMKYERIPARIGDAVTAFLVYGSRYRLDTHRGLPLLSVVLETLKKLERYKEATVGSAEERQKIAYFIKHELGSTGENPLQDLARISGVDSNNDIPIDDMGNQLADKIYATTNKQTFNMPINSTLESLESKSELYFKDFYTVNSDILFATINIPPNVALQKYDSNYSSSRAAIKDWDHTLLVKRSNWANQFERPVYTFWTYIEAIKGTLKMPGFLKAWTKKKWDVVEAWLNARFVGPKVPHIDPQKEVEAIRLQLGASGAALPLMTAEQASEELGGGDFDATIEQYASELERAKKLKIEMPEPPAKPVPPKQE